MTQHLRDALRAEYELAHDAIRPAGVAAVRAGAARRRRRRTVAATAALAVAVAAGAAVAWRSAPGGEPAQQVAGAGCDRPGVDVRLMLTPDSTDVQAERLDGVLRDSPEVYCLTYVTREEVWEQFRIQYSDAPELVNATKTDSLTARFQFRVAEPRQAGAVEQRVRGLDGFSDYICSCDSGAPSKPVRR